MVSVVVVSWAGVPPAAVSVVERLSAMVVGRRWLCGVSCARDVEIVLVCVNYYYFKQLGHSVLVSLSAGRETMLAKDTHIRMGIKLSAGIGTGFYLSLIHI